MLIYAYEQTNNNLYFQTALMQLNYILGSNAHNISFVTGVGSNPVMHPHHRPIGLRWSRKSGPWIISWRSRPIFK